MKQKMKNYGGVIGFYFLIIIAALIVNARFDYLNDIDTNKQILNIAFEK